MKRRLIRESISEEQQEQYLEMFTSIPADERKRIKKAIKECLKENGFSVGFLGGYALIGIMVLVIGIKFRAIETITAGFIMLASGGITLGTIQRKQLLQCAAKKLGMDLGEMLSKMRGEEESSEMIPESRRVVKLTESDLNRIVRRIIKEDEMMNQETSMSSSNTQLKNTCKATLKDLLKTSKNLEAYYSDKVTNDYDYFKLYYPKAYAKALEGEAWEPGPGGLSPIRRKFTLDKLIVMKEGSILEIEIITESGSRGDSYTLTCRGGKITISSSGSVGP